MASATTGRSSVCSDKVNVAIRVRPLIAREVTTGAKSRWRINGQTVQQVNPGTKSPTRGTPSYIFDYAFGPETETTEVYNTVVAPIVEKSFQGFNGTILCYGQTSSGKTHTLYGNEEDPGIISLMANDLFNRIRDGERVYYIRIGLLEIYNEKMTDLLNDNCPIEDMEVGGVVVPKNLTEIEVVSPEQILEAAKRVQLERKVGETIMNLQSSRSHTILRIMVESAPRESSDKKENNDKASDLHLTTAVLNFVDLAGSEKASKTKTPNSEERFTESNYINKSLTSLSKVVMELSKGKVVSANPNQSLSSTPTIPRRKLSRMPKMHNSPTPCGISYTSAAKPMHINFRDSKLTRILQSSLNGNAFVTMICNLTPVSVPESHSTLRFAKAAKEIKTDPTQNRKHLQINNEYEMKISELEITLREKTADLEKLKSQMFVMQSFQRVCSPVHSTPTSQIPKGIIRRNNSACNSQLLSLQKEFDLKFNRTPQGYNREAPKSPTITDPNFSIPFAEWARLKKDRKKIIVERETLRSKLQATETSEKFVRQENAEFKSQIEAIETTKYLLNQEILELNKKLMESIKAVASYKDNLVKAQKDFNTSMQSLVQVNKKNEKLLEEATAKLQESERLVGFYKESLDNAEKNLTLVKRRLNNALEETRSVRLLQAEIKFKESQSSGAERRSIDNETSFNSVGIQVSCNPYDTIYMNRLRKSVEKQVKLSFQDEKVVVNPKVRERVKHLESMALDNNLQQVAPLKAKQENVIINIEKMGSDKENKSSSETAAPSTTRKCRFPSFLS